MTELLLGCGNNKAKQITFPEIPTRWTDLITLDFDDSCSPDVVHDLTDTELPFEDNQFDEIHAYEVLEHTGTVGDFRFFFRQFEEFHRILKPDGWLIGSCPNWDSVWSFGDPGHTRVLSPSMLQFLSQEQYEKQVGKTAMTDYRFCYTANYELTSFTEYDENWAFAMRTIK
jgi:SAM-dependent methyltransferase